MSALTTNAEITTEVPSRVQAYVALTKLRISVMVLLTFAVAAVLAANADPDVSIGFGWMFAALVGMLMIASSGNAMNMYLERYSDFLMPRTAGRPLPAQRLSANEVASFAAVTFGIGVAFLFAAVNWETAVCGIANWILYVFIYTPLKRTTPLNTEIGAVAGAMPIVMGSLAATATVGLVCWSFFGVLLLWQFPHFMAIAWIYRDQYAKGGLKMLTVTEPTGAAAGRKGIVTGVLLIAVSLMPIMALRTQAHGWIFAVIAIVLGLYYLRPAIAFNADRNDVTARRLLRVSLLYLPAYMLLLIVCCLS
ncbi:MAG: protoheme IX farnesyltransferase [Mariniblastus sp.]|jgi:protoheme IX farnesyltransferase